MKVSQLVACSACARAIRAHETSCPFCAAPNDARVIDAPRAPNTRLSRAARYALGAGTLSFAAACSSTGGVNGNDDGGTANDAGHTPDAAIDGPWGGPLYGSPPQDAGRDVAADAGADADSGWAQAAYGGPPHDAGHDDAEPSNDAETTWDAPAPPYGAPPPPPPPPSSDSGPDFPPHP